jgi:hypothetical protein
MDLAAANHLSTTELRARYNLAGRLFEDDPRDALEILRGGVELSSRTGRLDWRYLFTDFLAASLHVAGSWDELIALLDEPSMDDGTPMSHRANALHVLASVAAARGDTEASRSALARATELVGDADDPQQRGEWATQDADVAIVEGRLNDAYAAAARDIPDNWRPIIANIAARAAIREHDPTRASAYLAGARRQQGRLTSALRLVLESAITIERGDEAGGLAGATEALRQIRALDVPRFVGDALVDLIFALGADHPAVTGFADEARAVYAGMGARRQLERLDEALAARSARPAAAAESAMGRTLVPDRSS